MDKKQDKILNRQFKRLDRQESRTMKPRENTFLHTHTAPLRELITEKTPEKLTETFRIAFEKGFSYLLTQGTGMIEKSCQAEKKRDAYSVNRFALGRLLNDRNIKRFDAQAKRGALLNQGLTAAEGGLLGVFGIGLPDIPVFAGVILKTVYEVAMSYGFDYTKDAEKIFVLQVICTACASDEERAASSAHADRIGWAIDTGAPCGETLQDALFSASDRLSGALVAAKMIQGIPLVGAVGAVTNYTMVRRISRTAVVKYKKRFLNKLR